MTAKAGKSEPMKAASQPPVAAGQLRLLVLGGDMAELPVLKEVAYVSDIKSGFDAAAVIEPYPAAQVAATLRSGGNPLAPVVTFGLYGDLRADFTAPIASPVTLRQAFATLGPIAEQLSELPDIAGHPDEDGLFALGLAHSRRKNFEAAWNPRRQDGIWYPFLGPVSKPRRRLEMLAELGLLRRKFFKRVNACGQCGSARLNAFEACVSCSSAQLSEEDLVHHYPCGYKAAEAEFVSDRDLNCPKCLKALRHLGVDYDRPGTVLTCVDCKTVMADPVIVLECMDCNHANPGNGVETVDWFNYELTPEGVTAFMDGRLPHLDFTALLSPLPRTYPLRDFVLLVREGIKVAQRYERPFSMMSITVANRGALDREYGVAQTAAAFRAMIDIFAANMREVDFMSANRSQSAVVAMPETPESNAEALATRLRKTVAESIELPIELLVRVASGDAAASMLEDLG